jgi:hypothetical protein
VEWDACCGGKVKAVDLMVGIDEVVIHAVDADGDLIAFGEP